MVFHVSCLCFGNHISRLFYEMKFLWTKLFKNGQLWKHQSHIKLCTKSDLQTNIQLYFLCIQKEKNPYQVQAESHTFSYGKLYIIHIFDKATNNSFLSWLFSTTPVEVSSWNKLENIGSWGSHNSFHHTHFASNQLQRADKTQCWKIPQWEILDAKWIFKMFSLLKGFLRSFFFFLLFDSNLLFKMHSNLSWSILRFRNNTTFFSSVSKLFTNSS